MKSIASNLDSVYGSRVVQHHPTSPCSAVGWRASLPPSRSGGWDVTSSCTDTAARFDAVSAEDRDRLRLWQGEPIDVLNPATVWPCFCA
jgi:hypothetical protein